jgi:uncharacterized damage-inducible protein DinB
MTPQEVVAQLKDVKQWFDQSSRCLTDEDSNFKPTQASMTVCQQVAHVAQTVDWLLEGAFRPAGFDMDFDSAARRIRKVKSLAEARAWADRAFANAISVLGAKSDEELMTPLPEGPLMGGLPRLAILGAIQDHTAHHRGALTVYSRMCGRVPTMPYLQI